MTYKHRRFEIERVSGTPVTDAELIADLQRLAAELGRETVPEPIYRARRQFDDSTLIRRFKSWNGALRAAGLQISQEINIPDDRLFENLLTLWQHYGRQPRRAELALPPSTVSQSPYMRRFGSWSAALTAFVTFTNSTDAETPIANVASDPAKGKRGGRDPSLRLRFQVLQRDSFSCQSCGASPAKASNTELHVDHVVPWSKGGDTTSENLRTLCAQCNLGRGNLDP